jgi:hypothetical protein
LLRQEVTYGAAVHFKIIAVSVQRHENIGWFGLEQKWEFWKGGERRQKDKSGRVDVNNAKLVYFA